MPLSPTLRLAAGLCAFGLAGPASAQVANPLDWLFGAIRRPRRRKSPPRRRRRPSHPPGSRRLQAPARPRKARAPRSRPPPGCLRPRCCRRSGRRGSHPSRPPSPASPLPRRLRRARPRLSLRPKLGRRCWPPPRRLRRRFRPSRSTSARSSSAPTPISTASRPWSAISCRSAATGAGRRHALPAAPGQDPLRIRAPGHDRGRRGRQLGRGARPQARHAGPLLDRADAAEVPAARAHQPRPGHPRHRRLCRARGCAALARGQVDARRHLEDHAVLRPRTCRR